MEKSMKKYDNVTPSELYRHLADFLGMVRWGGASFTVQKRGQALARLISAGDVPAGKDGKRRFPRPQYRNKAITPGRFRSRMSEYLSRARFGKQSVRIESQGKIVAIIVPPASEEN
jgi:antitoxin (DNA-binding transcriptional repressor) of toxin-antitoxin stability system